jgi:hypothetical protein
MSYDSELREASTGALTSQYERGEVLFAEPAPHRQFSPVPFLCRSTDSLWDAAMWGQLAGEAARYHFTACTYAAVRGLDPPGPAGSPSRILPGVIDALNDWFDEYGVGVLQQTKHLGCVVGLMTWAGRLAHLPTGGSYHTGAGREAWINVLVRSVTAETLYLKHPEAVSEAVSLPHAASDIKTGVGV